MDLIGRRQLLKGSLKTRTECSALLVDVVESAKMCFCVSIFF